MSGQTYRSLPTPANLAKQAVQEATDLMDRTRLERILHINPVPANRDDPGTLRQAEVICQEFTMALEIDLLLEPGEWFIEFRKRVGSPGA